MEDNLRRGRIGERIRRSFRNVLLLFSVTVMYAVVALVLTQFLPSGIIKGYVVGTVLLLAVIVVIAARMTARLGRELEEYIATPVVELTEVAKQIAAGNLDVSITYQSDDELGDLADSFRQTVSTLNEIIQDLNNILEEFAKGNYAVRSQHADAYVGNFKLVLERLVETVTNVSQTLHMIRESSDQVAAGAEQLAVSSQDLAKGATDQAAAVDALVESVSEVTNQVVANSKSTDVVHDKAKEVGAEAVNSQKKMEELTKAMGRIFDASQQLEQVIGQIESIASQTNLLSLNASIEAARAGEAGRGFAVVAEQIRMLAEDSAKSAETSKQLLEANQKEVGYGNEVTQQTAESLNKVLTELDVIIGEVASIRVASDQQAASVRKIEQGVKQIGDTIQSNSAASEETSATSEELSAEADSLDGLIAKFRLRA